MPEIGNKIANADIDLIDETFSVTQSGSYHLSIQIEPDRLSFAVYNTVINKYIVLRSYPLFDVDPLQDDHASSASAYRPFFENDKLFRLSYKSSSLLWVSPRSTLVPDHLFDPAQAAVYMAFNHGVFAGEHILYRYIWGANSYCVFSCPEELTSLARMRQPRIHFFHQLTPFIEAATSNTPSEGKADMTVFFYSRWLDVVILKKDKLLFYNSYKINAPADSVYYLAGLSNLFDIDLKSVTIKYAGNLQQAPPEIAILTGFVDCLEECEQPKAFTYSQRITDPLRKNFINLFNLYRCE